MEMVDRSLTMYPEKSLSSIVRTPSLLAVRAQDEEGCVTSATALVSAATDPDCLASCPRFKLSVEYFWERASRPTCDCVMYMGRRLCL